MNNIQFTNCCGCATCASCCPQNAISMRVNEKGFYESYVDENDCIHCGICTKVCATILPLSLNSIKNAFAYKVTSLEKRILSQSGGAFYSIAQNAVGQGWVVYGVVYNDGKAVYIGTENQQIVMKMRGSKYIQAHNPSIQKDIANNLLNGKKVLLCGTPCLIEGVKKYLSYKEIDDHCFYAIDIVCHGVPSPLIFNNYRKYLIDKYGECLDFNFRDKTIGWDGHICSFKANGKKYYSDDYVKIFYSDLVLNDSCYSCNYTSKDRAGDLTIGDLWGASVAYPDIYDNYGVSLLCVNTLKGELLKKMLYEKELIEIDIEKCLQKNLYEPSDKSPQYEQFWIDYYKDGYGPAINKYINCLNEEIEAVDYFWNGYNLKSLFEQVREKQVYLYGVGLTMVQLVDCLKSHEVKILGIMHRDSTYMCQTICGYTVVDNINITDDTRIIICSKNIDAINDISERLKKNFGVCKEQIVALSDYLTDK